MLLTVDEAATIMRISPRTVRRQVEDGTLKGVRVGRQIRLPIDQFSGYVDVKAVAAEISRRAQAALAAQRQAFAAAAHQGKGIPSIDGPKMPAAVDQPDETVL